MIVTSKTGEDAPSSGTFTKKQGSVAVRGKMERITGGGSITKIRWKKGDNQV